LPADIICNKLNEVYLKIECDRSISMELNEFFSFYIKNFQFHPKVKAKMWDGKLRLFDLKNRILYIGLLSKLIQFCKSNAYEISIDKNLHIKNEIVNDELLDVIKNIKLLDKFKLRDYQVNSLKHFLKFEKMLLISPTGSGKSLSIYSCINSIINDVDKILILVPNVSLVHQMYDDFEQYGFDSEKYCHRIYSGISKQSSKKIFISTWQSIYNNDPEYFEQFQAVIADECHLCSATSLTNILNACINARYKIGATGSLDESKTNELVLVGLFGNIFRATSTIDLMNKGQLSPLDIKCLLLKHHNIDKAVKKWSFSDEMQYLASNNVRNNFIKNLADSLKGNTLILFTLIEKHGKILNELLKSNSKKVYFIHGGVEVKEREEIRKILEVENNCIILASYGTFSTGVNAPNISNIIFASSYKSQVKVIQSIGRGLRLHINKKQATLYDIADDLRIDKHVNFTLKHLNDRLSIYDKEKFEYKIYKINLGK